MPLMQQMMRPAMALAPTPPQFAHMMRPGQMGIAPGMYNTFQLHSFNLGAFVQNTQPGTLGV